MATTRPESGSLIVTRECIGVSRRLGFIPNNPVAVHSTFSWLGVSDLVSLPLIIADKNPYEAKVWYANCCEIVGSLMVGTIQRLLRRSGLSGNTDAEVNWTGHPQHLAFGSVASQLYWFQTFYAGSPSGLTFLTIRIETCSSST